MIAILHAYSCDGVCGKRMLVEATAQGESKTPAGWRNVEGITWCGAPTCRDNVVTRYRAVVTKQAEAAIVEFSAVAQREVT